MDHKWVGSVGVTRLLRQVDEGEGSLRALKREIREEVGLAVDDSFAPLHLGGMHLRYIHIPFDSHHNLAQFILPHPIPRLATLGPFSHGKS